MVFCTKCGNKNVDTAEYCGKCGAPLKDKTKKPGDEMDKRCEEECAGGKHGVPIFWGIVVILIGLWILFEFVIKNTNIHSQLPTWLQNFEFWWLIALVIAIAVIMTGIRILVKK